MTDWPKFMYLPPICLEKYQERISTKDMQYIRADEAKSIIDRLEDKLQTAQARIKELEEAIRKFHQSLRENGYGLTSDISYPAEWDELITIAENIEGNDNSDKTLGEK